MAPSAAQSAPGLGPGGGRGRAGSMCAVRLNGKRARCLAGACVVGCPGGVVYVSSAGNDAADGCTPASALADRLNHTAQPTEVERAKP